MKPALITDLNTLGIVIRIHEQLTEITAQLFQIMTYVGYTTEEVSITSLVLRSIADSTNILEVRHLDEIIPDLLGLSESLQQHGRPSQIAFALFELLTAADYTDEEILTVAHELEELVS